MASTTIDTETELSAVNSILGAIGQAPLTSLVYDNPEVSFVYNILRDANIDIQNEGWHFNTEKHVQHEADANGKIAISADVLRLDVSKGWSHRYYDVVKRYNSKDKVYYLYDKYDHTDVWTAGDKIDLDEVKLYTFVDLPEVFKRYVVARASRVAATQLVNNTALVQLLTQQETLSRASVIEYECNQGNHSMFGFPEDSVYQTYQPWRNLRR